MTVSIIVAVAEQGVIGRSGTLPWHLPADLARFKRLTMGHTLVMGRRTFESIGRPLPGRTTLVVTRQTGFHATGARAVGSLREALELAAEDPEVFVAGGAEIYRQALPLADRLYVTRVHAHIEGDTYFPSIDPNHWQLEEETFHSADSRNPYDLTFQVYRRVGREPGRSGGPNPGESSRREPTL